MSRWDDKDDWERKTDREVLEDIQTRLTAEGLGREDDGTLPLGGARGRLGNHLGELRNRIGWMVRELRYRLRPKMTRKQLAAECAPLGLVIEEPSAIALRWLFERAYRDVAIDMAEMLRREGAKAEVKVELHERRTKGDVEHWGPRCGEAEWYYKHTLWVIDPEEDAEPVEVWHWFRSIAAGEYDYRTGDPEWSEEVEPGWWNWENTPPTDLFIGFDQKEQQLCEALGVHDSWPPWERILRADIGKHRDQ